MRRTRIILFVIFLLGVLLGGIGVGTVMVEWSSMEYGGCKQLGEEYLVTEDLDHRMKDDGSKLILDTSYSYLDRYMEPLEEDASVPEGVVRYEVTYNSRLVEPVLRYVEWERPEEPPADTESTEPEELPADADGTEPEETSAEAKEPEPVYDGLLYLSVDPKSSDARWSILMENKDEILEELKQGRFSDYDFAQVTKIQIRVNPATMPYVEDQTRR